MLIKWVRRYRDLFIDVFYLAFLSTSDFRSYVHVGLVHYGFVTLRRNYSCLILEHVRREIGLFEE